MDWTDGLGKTGSGRISRRVGGVMVAVLLAAGAAGCVQRELTITSEPPGALVFLNDLEVGRTPVTRQFTFYGTYDVRLRKEGYQTLKTKSLVLAPWWQWVPIDLAAELLPLTDRQAKHFVLQLDPGASVAGATTLSAGPAESSDTILARAGEQKARLPGEAVAKAATAPAVAEPTKAAPATTRPAVAVPPIPPPPPAPLPAQPPATQGIIEIPNPK